MKKIIVVCIALVAMALSFNGCSANDRAVKIGTAVHGMAKAGYSVGGGLLGESTQKTLETTSKGLDKYGENRKVVRSLQDSKKPIVDTSKVSN